jgi:hypothetical protein
MKLKQLGANMTLLMKQDLSQTEVLFSYETPVAVNWLGSKWTFIPEDHISNTTTNHINKYLKDLASYPNDSENHHLFKEVPLEWIASHV